MLSSCVAFSQQFQAVDARKTAYGIEKASSVRRAEQAFSRINLSVKIRILSRRTAPTNPDSANGKGRSDERCGLEKC